MRYQYPHGVDQVERRGSRLLRQLSGGVLFGFLGQSRAQRAAARSSQGQEQAARSATGAPDFDLLVPAHESLHFLQGNGAIVVGIHCLEYALVRRLKLLQ